MTEPPYVPSSADRDRVSHGETKPDPSALTTQLTLREIASLEKIISTRLDAMDRAMIIFQESLTRVPTDTDKQVGGLKSLMAERFNVIMERFASIETQFRERSVQREQSSRESKEAITAAFQAAKDSVSQQNASNALAISKSESAMVKQMDAFEVLLNTSISALDGKIADIKDRLTTIEGRTSGASTAQALTQGNQVQWVGIIAACFAILFGGAALIMALAKPDAPAAVERVVERVPPVVTERVIERAPAQAPSDVVR
jgi:hypothetical protein